MTKAPSIEEALELLPCPFCGGESESDSHRHYRNISTGNLEKSAAIYCTSCNADMMWCYRDTPEIEREQVMSLLIEQWNTRATLQPDGERREAIAKALWETHDGSKWYPWAEMPPYDRECYYKYADALFASGLVQDEAGIRADEREKCAKIADREAEFWQDAESSSARIVAANIRSARNGGNDQ